MDIGYGLGIFAAGITATLGTIKLIRFVARDREEEESGEHSAQRQYDEHPPLPNETVKDYKERLFPNGEKDAIFAQIEQLRQDGRDRVREQIAIVSEQKSIRKAFEDLSERLARHGI